MGIFFGPLDQLANALANTAAFRSFCGAADAAEALATYLFVDEADVPDPEPESYAAISWRLHQQNAYELAGASGDVYKFELQLGLFVTSYVALSTANRQAFDDSLTAIFRELRPIVQAYDLRVLGIHMDAEFTGTRLPGSGAGYQAAFVLPIQLLGAV